MCSKCRFFVVVAVVVFGFFVNGATANTITPRNLGEMMIQCAEYGIALEAMPWTGGAWYMGKNPADSGLTINIPVDADLVVNRTDVMVMDDVDDPDNPEPTPDISDDEDESSVELDDGSYTNNVNVIRPGDDFQVAAKSYVTNADGSLLTAEMLSSICWGFVNKAWVLDYSIGSYFVYRDKVEFYTRLYQDLNLGEGWERIIVNEEKPVEAEPEVRSTDKRSVGIKPATPVSADQESDTEPDKPAWTPNVVRNYDWVRLLDKSREGGTRVIVSVPTSEVMIMDDTHDESYRQLLAEKYGPKAHLVCRGGQLTNYWVLYRPDRSVSLQAEMVFSYGRYRPAVKSLRRGEIYWVIDKFLLEEGVIISTGTLQERLTLVATPPSVQGLYISNAKKNVTVSSGRTQRGDDLSDHIVYKFHHAGERLVLAASEVAQIAVCDGQSLTLNGQPFMNVIDTVEMTGDLELRAVTGKQIGFIEIYERTSEQKLDFLANLDGNEIDDAELQTQVDALLTQIYGDEATTSSVVDDELAQED